MNKPWSKSLRSFGSASRSPDPHLRCDARSVDEFAIQALIARGGFAPGEIARHGAFHQGRPGALIVENFAGAFDGIPEGVGRSFVAKETETGIHRRIVIFDDLLDASCGAGDG